MELWNCQIGALGLYALDNKLLVSLIARPKKEFGAWGGGKVTFEGKAKIGSACRIICNSNGNIIFGDGVNITGRTSVISDNKISIGAKSLISWDCLLMDTDFHKVVDKNESV